MKNYTITVNGNVYDVTVEEGRGLSKTTQVAEAPKAMPVAQAPKTAPIVETPKATSSGVAGSVRVEAGAAGKIFKVEVQIGKNVKAGESILILEAMKMEIPVVAPQDGTVSSIDVSVGDTVEAGTLLATLN